jgi:hypothetical protein
VIWENPLELSQMKVAEYVTSSFDTNPWNASFYFSFLIFNSRYGALDEESDDARPLRTQDNTNTE